MADQLDLVKNLPLTPDFIINIKVGTECHLILILPVFLDCQQLLYVTGCCNVYMVRMTGVVSGSIIISNLLTHQDMHDCVQYLCGAFVTFNLNFISHQIPDKDLEKRRCEQRVDPLTDVLYTKSEYAPEVTTKEDKDKDEEDEEEEEEEEEAEEEMIEEEEEVGYQRR